MPFDEREFAAPGAEGPAGLIRNRRLVAGWLFLMCFMILVMVVLGGVTRLTGSGLSIMEWAPVSGVLPPLNKADWQQLFALYRQIPQYKLVNAGFGLAGFQHIFWLEWTHRLWGRLIGLAFLGPLIWFWATGRIERSLRPRLVLLFVLGGLQGAVGWFMVASGFLPDETSVEPYRLALHLSLALVLYGAILWTGLGVLRPRRMAPGSAGWLRPLTLISIGLLCVTIVAGSFVAGTHAGFDYNTFPLMAGRWVPAGYARLHPFLRNLFENIPAVQFDHRLLATMTVLSIAMTLIAGLRLHLPRLPRIALFALALTIAVQYSLGVATLLLVVPVPLAAAHQANAVLVLTAVLTLLYGIGPGGTSTARARR